MLSSTGTSFSVTTCPFLKRGPLDLPGMIWVMSWQRMWPTASSVLMSFIFYLLMRMGSPGRTVPPRVTTAKTPSVGMTHLPVMR